MFIKKYKQIIHYDETNLILTTLICFLLGLYLVKKRYCWINPTVYLFSVVAGISLLSSAILKMEPYGLAKLFLLWNFMTYLMLMGLILPQTEKYRRKNFPSTLKALLAFILRICMILSTSALTFISFFYMPFSYLNLIGFTIPLFLFTVLMIYSYFCSREVFKRTFYIQNKL
ncbi:hypothetical protein CXF72_05100 [Psychromonas sp. MB-3u-54]|uniref:hypothetical protein n=1 Tax=Psychromonas sp. MB-3u-54 TaxID=2058319 RepID=UPI000C3284AC|nr:hypothetical protein [Psychromonas sp. MB-3u-54]PKH03646.1 hypothetical protein CXF72_05100 [Psychromonas sp. MB-3u-54]